MPISSKLLSKLASGKFNKHILNLADKQVSDKECAELVDILNNVPAVTILDLSDNLDNMGDDGYKALSKLKYVKTLYLSFNQISVQAIKYLNENVAIESLRLDHCYLTAPHMAELAKHPTVKHLCISSNDMWSNNESSFFKDNKILEKLDISGNNLLSKELDELSKNQTIKDLSLYQNLLTDDCVPKLLSMPSLTHVDVDSNFNMSAKAVTFLYSELAKRPKPIEGIDEKKIAHDKPSI